MAQVVPQRNDKWMNSHVRPIFEVWLANIDIQLIIDKGKVIEYLTKYMTKVETINETGIKRMFTKLLDQNANDNGDPIVALRKMMLRLLGQRTYGRQEVSHLMNNLPIVRSSHKFSKFHIKSSSVPLLLENSSKKKKKEQKLGESVVSLTFIELYARRLDLKH